MGLVLLILSAVSHCRDPVNRARRITAGRAFAAAMLGLLGGDGVADDGPKDIAPLEPDQAELRPLVEELIGWIGEHGDYDVARFLENPPEISFCDCGETIDYEGRTIVVHEPVKGVYDLEVNRITLVRPWDRQDLLNISSLLHELVHVVQYHSKEWPCWHATEWEAYKLQEQWLLERGIDPGFNWVEIQLLSSCTRRDIHR